MSDRWLTIEEMEELTGWSRRTIRQKCQHGKVSSRLRSVRGRNGAQLREFDARSLPSDIQKRWMQKLIASRETSLALASSESGAATAQMPMFPSSNERLAVTPEQHRQADERYRIISPVLEFLDGKTVPFETRDGAHIDTADAYAAWIANQNGKDRSTIWRWIRRFRASGLSGLLDEVRKDKGKSRFFEDQREAQRFIENKYLNERLSIQLVFESLRDNWARLRRGTSRPPCYSTVRAYLQALPQPLGIMARQGPEAYGNKCAPYLIRGYSERPNEYWVSDHCKHDVWVYNDGMFPGLEIGAELRPWLTAFMDYRSRKIVGTAWCYTPSSHSISSALRVGIERFGVPANVYIDNGKDYQAVGKVELSPECSGVLTRLRVKVTYAVPFHPQAKPIESFFATLHKRFDAQWGEFYCGASPQDRSELCDAALKEHRRYRDGKARTSPLPAAREFVQMAYTWLEEDYNERHAHTGRGMNGRTPNEVFEELLPSDVRRLPEDPRTLDALFWSREQRQVMEGGCVQLLNERYEPADERSAAMLFSEIGRRIMVACDPLNLGEAIALDLEGRVLGTLRASRLVAMGPVSHDDIRAISRQRATYRKAVKGYLEALRFAARDRGDITELQALRQRAGLGVSAARLERQKALPAARPLAVNEQPYVGDVVDDLVDLMKLKE